MGTYGLLGEKLGHSFSPQIHRLLGGYDYRLIEVAPDALDDFMRSADFDGLNVTIPYKKAVVPYCAELSPRAAALGNVNTIVRRPDGSLYGDNTDYCGFETLVRASGISVAGTKCAVLGSGGASCTAQAVLRDLGAAQVLCISRSGVYNYTDISPWQDADILVNATPVGMYPGNGSAPVDIAQLPGCRAVFDLIYNPARTRLMLDAEARNIPAFGGLLMLVAQARAAAELFTGRSFGDDCVRRIAGQLAVQTGNIILIGMAGCGKTSVGKALARRTGREFVDTDELFEEKAGISPSGNPCADRRHQAQRTDYRNRRRRGHPAGKSAAAEAERHCRLAAAACGRPSVRRTAHVADAHTRRALRSPQGSVRGLERLCI